MIIHATNFVLRNFELSDIPEFYEKMHNDEVAKEYVPSAYPYDIEEAAILVNLYSGGDNINDFYFVIEKSNKMVGIIIAVRTIGKTLDTSAVIFEPYRGKGVMTRVLNFFKKWLQNNTDYESLTIVVNKTNTPSLQHIQKCGVTFIKEDDEYRFYKIYLREGSTMAVTKSREQCFVIEKGQWTKVTSKHVGKAVYDKKTNEQIGTLVEPNPNTKMLRLKLLTGETVTIK